MPRQTKLTPELSTQIIMGVRLGNFMETVAASHGVDARTLRNWLKRGTKGGKANELFRNFRDGVLEGQAEAKIRMFVAIGKSDDWRANQYRLGVLDPEVYGNQARVRLEVESTVRDLLKIAERILPSALYEKLLEEITARFGCAAGADAVTGEQE